MYTEGFDELSEAAENRPSRTYVSSGGQDALKLQRENERLKKSLEKEQFFNRLLDQELKDLKLSVQSGMENQQYNNGRANGVSRSAFNILLVITVLLAGYIVYSFVSKDGQKLFPASSAVPEASTPKPAPVKDSVPNIIAKRKSLPPIVGQQNAPVADRTPAERSLAAASKDNKAKTKPERAQQPVAADPADDHAQAETTAVEPPAAAAQTPAAAPVERQPIATYIVTSKANFYSAPDENTLRSYFISPGGDKVVNALEENNGFIYVEFKNDVGYVTKGWLSKADLTKQ